MSEQGHTGAITANITQADDRKAWHELSQKPFPKILSGFESVANVTFGMIAGGMISPKENWGHRMGYPDTSSYPVKGTIYVEPTHRNPRSGGANLFEKAHSRLSRMQQELSRAGCNTVIIEHVASTPEETVTQYGLFHPDEIINKKRDVLNDNPRVFDTEGRAIFLAYLLHKRKLTEVEVTSVNASNRFLQPFGKRWLETAREPQYQEAIRQALRASQTEHSVDKQKPAARKR